MMYFIFRCDPWEIQGNKNVELLNFEKNSVQQMEEGIRYFSDLYNIPEDYFRKVAYHETGYNGQETYNPSQISKCGALGPMQIMFKTAKFFNDSITEHQLLNDVYLNLHLSAKMLRYLKDKYQDWEIVFGYYNTGYPESNKYAKKIVNRE